MVRFALKTLVVRNGECVPQAFAERLLTSTLTTTTSVVAR
jgi:hypothetical protein